VHWAGAVTIIAAGRELVALLLAHRREAEASRKQCPDCINEVHADAKRCHHYGYRFLRLTPLTTWTTCSKGRLGTASRNVVVVRERCSSFF
jgi:hypothetical protein